MQYQVTIGAVHSRQKRQRRDIRALLGEVAALLNKRFGDRLARPLERYESHSTWIGALGDGGSVPWFVFDLMLETWPDAYGIVIEGPRSPMQTALHPSSAMLSLSVRRERIFVRGPLGLDVYRSTTILWDSVAARWSASQVATLRSLRASGTQRRVAETMGITPQSVSEILQRAQWPALKKSLWMMERLLA